MNKKEISKTQLVLTATYVAVLLISNIIATKMISLPFNYFGLNYVTCAVIVFPITCILSDVFSEVYGYKWSRYTCYLGFALNLMMSAFFFIAIKLPCVIWWTDNDIAFSTTLGSTFYLLASSYIAYMSGDFLNDKIFAKIKDKYHKDDHKKFGVRAVLSTLCGQLLDSSIYLPLGFIVFPLLFSGSAIMSVGDAFLMVSLQAIIKTSYEFFTLPITNIIVNKVAKIEK